MGEERWKEVFGLIILVSLAFAQSGCKLKGTYNCEGGLISGVYFGVDEDDDDFEYYVEYYDYDNDTSLSCGIYQQGVYSIQKDIIMATFYIDDRYCFVSTDSPLCHCVSSLQFRIYNNCGIISGPTNETCTPAATCEDLLQCENGEAPIDDPNEEPSINGCGPSSLPITGPEFSFGPCCGNHDVCYGTCGSSKVQCDNDFYQCMVCSCREAYDSAVSETFCEEVACNYFQAVDEFGCSAFTSSQERACMCPGEGEQKKKSQSSRIPSKYGSSALFSMRETEAIFCKIPFNAECEEGPNQFITGWENDPAFVIVSSCLSFMFLIILTCFLCCCVHKKYRDGPTKEETFTFVQMG